MRSIPPISMGVLAGFYHHRRKKTQAKGAEYDHLTTKRRW